LSLLDQHRITSRGDGSDEAAGSRTDDVLGDNVLRAASRVHCVGMGGTGVRALVPIFLARGMTVSGSDAAESSDRDKFREQGVAFSVGHAGENLDPSTDVVLISAAVRSDNPEVVAANRNHIPVIKYAEGLGYLMAEKQGIAVSGTHGKTTTTTMVSHVLLHAGEDPSFVIGGEYTGYGGSSRSGDGRHFVAEACEFDHSFLNLRPSAAIVTNIEEDHLDYFESLDDIKKAFSQFIDLLPDAGGLLVINDEDENSQYLRKLYSGPIESFSLNAGRGDWWAENIVAEGESTCFKIVARDGRSVDVRLPVPGLHNVRNALAATAVCSWAGLALDDIQHALDCYTGVRRRFDVLARQPVTVIDDYAHHPTEVATLLRAARAAYPTQRIVGVFQPHQHSRLRLLLGDFADSLSEFDDVLVTNVFHSRDGDDAVRAIDSSALVNAIRARGKACYDTPSFDESISRLESTIEPGDVVLFMGAGTVTNLAKRYAERVKSESTS